MPYRNCAARSHQNSKLTGATWKVAMAVPPWRCCRIRNTSPREKAINKNSVTQLDVERPLPLRWPAHANIVEEACCRPDRAAGAGICSLPLERDAASWRFQRYQTAASSPKRKSIPSYSFRPGHLWLLCTSLSSMEGFSAKSGAVAFRDDLRPDPGRIFGNFSAGARRRAGAAFVAGAEGEVACFRYVWNLRIGTPFRLGKCGCHCGDWFAALQIKCAIWWSREQVGSCRPNGWFVFFC